MAAPRRFFSRPIPVFDTVGTLILCLVFILLPFALRGARMAVQGIKNNVADWLPKDYEETVDLGEFRKYFVGDQFVVVSGEWCREDNPAFMLLKRKIYEESLDYEQELRKQEGGDDIIEAHRLGDKLGLMLEGNLHETWGLYAERWLKGKDDKWYFINRNGDLYEWDGQNNVIEGIKRFFERMAEGRNRATGRFIDHFGLPPDDEKGIPNKFYNDPSLLCARPFKSVTSGPDALAQMAGPQGTLRIGDVDNEDAAAFEAWVEANKRLTGVLFGSDPPPLFKWTFESLLQTVAETPLYKQLKSTETYRTKFEQFVRLQLETRFDNDLTKLQTARESDRLDVWLRLWDALELTPPPRQTCLIVTINDPFLEELDRIVGRPLFGKQRGRIYELASGAVGLASENVHLGGPPSDNVAIDEEGTSSLLRLASLSGMIGLILAYYSFRSLRATLMMFFVGGVSAIASLSYVWYGGSQMDAILMTMPSLIYVLAISASVHLVNYYRDACHEVGPSRAVEIAVKHGWFPCFLAAFTTALGLFSLCTSNLAPIWKFGFFSGIATLATLFFIYTFLPAALSVWPPGYRRLRSSDSGSIYESPDRMARVWHGMYHTVSRNYAVVLGIAIILMVLFGIGVTKIQTTVQLLKLFDEDSKVLKDYRWMEGNLGKLVPMEILLNVDARAQQELNLDVASGSNEQLPTTVPPSAENDEETENRANVAKLLKLSLLERMEISYRVRSQLERFFGPDQLNIVGAGMSTDVFVPIQLVQSQLDQGSSVDYRQIFNTRLVGQRPAMLEQDYLAVADQKSLNLDNDTIYTRDPHYHQREMWRVSLRLAALKDVDYGKFVNDLKMVVEPIMYAYQYRVPILSRVYEKSPTNNRKRDLIVLLGRNPKTTQRNLVLAKSTDEYDPNSIDQTYLFSSTLNDLLENRGFDKKQKVWVDPTSFGKDKPFPSQEEWSKLLKSATCVVLVEDHELFDPDFIAQQTDSLVDCRLHRYSAQQTGEKATAQTAMNRKTNGAGEEIAVTATYTGIVPIVYKAQGALLKSLIESIVLSFLMISVVMMVLLRDWNRPLQWNNLLNFRGGLISMIPNVFPIVLIFGAMGFLGNKVDIGSMMTASVALGIAVDDTIHFLSWFRQGCSDGMPRAEAIKLAYNRCGSAMLQTSLIAGLGLSVFALSTFAPTQRFGVLMLILLGAALIGDLLILPALLASPLGRFFTPSAKPNASTGSGSESLPIPAGNAVNLRVVEFTEADDSQPDAELRSKGIGRGGTSKKAQP